MSCPVIRGRTVRSACAATTGKMWWASLILVLIYTPTVLAADETSIRNITVTGNFFRPLAWVDYLITNVSRAPYTVIMTVEGDTWHTDIATDVTRTKGLVDNILVSNRHENEAGYEFAWEFQVNNISNWTQYATRDSDHQVTLYIPPMPTYVLDADTFEFLGSASLPIGYWLGGVEGQALTSGLFTNYSQEVIEASIEPLVASIVSTGSTGFFRTTSNCPKTGSAIVQGPAVCCDLVAEPGCADTPEVIAGWEVKVDLLKGGATWNAFIAEDHSLREALLNTILHSVYTRDSEGYEAAMDFQLGLNLPHLSITLASATRVIIKIPKLPGYRLPAWTEQEAGETISVQPIDSYLLDSSYTGPQITNFIGTTSVEIISSTAVYSGTFFREGGIEYWDRVAISDEQMQLVSQGDSFIISIELKGEVWDYCIDKAPGVSGRCGSGDTALRLYQTLVEAVLHSNHRMTEQGYGSALEAMIQDFLPENIAQQSNSRVTITLPKYPAYSLEPSAFEEIQATTLPGNLFGSGAELSNQFGTVNALIASRTASYSGTFFGEATKTDDHILSAQEWTVSIQLVVDKWADDLFNTPWRKKMLFDTVFASNKNETNAGYEAAMAVQRATTDGSGEYVITVVQENARRITITMPSLPNYRLPPNRDLHFNDGAEVITAQTLPWQLLDGHSDLVYQTTTSGTGPPTLTIQSRTADYYVGNYPDAQLFFPRYPQGSVYLNEFWPSTTYRTDYELNAPTEFNIFIELVNSKWAYDIASNSTKRQALIDAVLATDRSAADVGYENAMATQRQNFSEVLVTRSTSWLLEIKVPQMAGYTLPTNSTELVDADPIPNICLIDSLTGEMQASALPNKLGQSSVTIFSRTAQYSGTFLTENYLCSQPYANNGGQTWCPETMKTEYHMQDSNTYTIFIDLVAEEWRRDIVTNSTKRMALINAVIDSSRVSSESGYHAALQYQTQTFDSALVVRVTSSKIMITVPQYTTYDLPPLGSETIQALQIPGICVADGVDVVYQVGLTAVTLYSRTASYSGTFFNHPQYKTESHLRAQTFVVTIDLFAEQWPDDVVTNAVTRQTVIDSVFSSSRNLTESGYELALQSQFVNFPESNMFLDSNTSLRIISMIMPTFALPGEGSELITALDLPRNITMSAGGDVLKQTGITYVTIYARTAMFLETGTFFSDIAKTEYDMQSTGTFTIRIKLMYEHWHTQLTSDRDKRNLLTDALLTSNRAAGGVCNVLTYDAYQCAMETQRYTICSQDPQVTQCTNIQLQDYCNAADQVNNPENCNSELKVVIPSLPNYRLPVLGTETITTVDIPAAVTQGTSDIVFQVGTRSLLISARTVSFSGSFFGINFKTDEDMQSAEEFTVVIDLVADTWVSNIMTLKQDLIDLVLDSSKDSGAPGYENAFMSQRQSWPTSNFVLTSSSQLTITIPSLPTYALPAAQMETIALLESEGGIPSKYLNGGSLISLLDGNRSVDIQSRTIKYSGTFFDGNAFTPGYVTDGWIRADPHTIILELVGDFFQADVSSNPTVRQALLDGVLRSNASASMSGYQNAMAAQIQNLTSSDVVLEAGNKIVTITLPALSGYDLPGFGLEVITASISPVAVLGSTEITTTNDVHSILIQGRTHVYSGTFFAGTSEGALTADDMSSPPLTGLSIIVTLLYETWDVNVRTDPVKRQLLIDSIMSSDHAQSESDYVYAMDYQTDNFGIESISLDISTNTVEITVPAFKDIFDGVGAVLKNAYFLPTSTSEVITARTLDASLLGSGVSLTENQQSGDTQVQINAAAATYSGSFFSQIFKTDDDMRSSIVLNISIELYGTKWPANIGQADGNYQQLAETVLASNRLMTDSGYSAAMTGSIQSFNFADITRVSQTLVIFNIMPYPNYALPAHGSEVIKVPAAGLPAAVLTGSVPLSNTIGLTNVTIFARTASFSGTFFDDSVFKTDEQVRFEGGYSIIIDITLAKFHVNVSTDGTIVAALVDQLFASTRTSFIDQVNSSITTAHIVRVNDTRITITIPTMASYALPALGSETVSVNELSAAAIDSYTNIVSLEGVRSILIKARSAVYVSSSSYPQPFFRSFDDTDDSFREQFLARTIAIELIAAEWEPDVHTDFAKKSDLIDSLFISNRTMNDTGYETAFDYQKSVLKASAAVFDRKSNTLLVITVTQLSLYALPVLSSEKVSTGIIPASAILGDLGIALKTGDTELEIHARTATFSGTFFETYLNNEHIRNSDLLFNSWTVIIDLYADEWQDDISTSQSLRNILVANVLSSNRLATDVGYENALATQFETIPQSMVTRNSDTRITIIVAALSTYALPAGGTETITAGVIPQSLVKGVNQITLQTGIATNTIIARTATYSGTFFSDTTFTAPGYTQTFDAFKSVEDITANTNFSVQVKLLGDLWHADVATDVTLRQGLIDAVLSSDYSSSVFGYDQAWEVQRANWLEQNVFRLNDTDVLINVPSRPNYFLQPSQSELITATAIPGGCMVRSNQDISLKLGISSISLRDRAAEYSGTFFRVDDRIDGDITNAFTYTIIIQLYNELWHVNISSDATLRQTLIDAVMTSDRAPTDVGFDKGLIAENQNFDASFVERTSDTQITVTVPSYPVYYLPPYMNETIVSVAIPKACLYGTVQFPVDVTSQLGLRQVTIKARTARFAGTFFTCDCTTCTSSDSAPCGASDFKTDEQLRSGGVGGLFTIEITLIGNSWLSDVASSSLRRMSLLRSVLTSNRGSSEAGYENAIATYLTDSNAGMWPEKGSASLTLPGVYRVSDSNLLIVLPPLPGYVLPGGQTETLNVTGIPRDAQDGSEDIITMAGFRQIDITPRTAIYSGTFFDAIYKTDQELRVHSVSLPYTVIIQLTHATWDVDDDNNGVIDPSKREVLVKAVLGSNKLETDSGYSKAMAFQTDFYEETVPSEINGAPSVEVSADLTTITIYIPPFVATETGLSDYALPALGSEIISAGEIPDDVISSATGLPSTLGQTSLEIKARTITYSGDYYSTVYKTDDHIRSITEFMITLDLTASFWVTNINGSGYMEQIIADTIFASSRTSSNTGYELATHSQITNFYSANPQHIVRVSNTSVTVVVPQFMNYELPAHGQEVISPLSIPAMLVQDAAVLTLKSGTSTLTINARTAAFSGSFFSADYKTDADIRGADWNIFIDLTYDFWAVDVVLDATKRQGLVNVIMASDRLPTDAGYAFALATQKQNWPAIQMVRETGTRVRIDIVRFPGYTVPPFGVENVAASVIPAEMVFGVTSVKPRAGIDAVVIHGRTATYSGTLFDSAKSDEDMQVNSHSVIVDLSYETWHPDVVTDSVKRQLLIDSVLHSNRQVTDFGYSLAMATQRASFLEANVVLGDCTGIHCSKLTITVPPFSSYALTALGSETLTAQDLPASIVNSTESVTLQSGTTSVVITGRSVTYSGTFFSTVDKLDDDIRNPAAAFTVIAVLTAEKWDPAAISSDAKRQVLIESILFSNQHSTSGGFENGFAKMIENFPIENVIFTNQTAPDGSFDSGYESPSICALCDIIIITLPSFPNYISGRLPTYYNEFEVIETTSLPQNVLQGTREIENSRMSSGQKSVTILARYLLFSGTFFSPEGKTAEDLQDGREFLVIIDIYRDTWHPDLVTNATLRDKLVEYVFTSNHQYSEAGYEHAMNKQVLFNFPQSKIVLASSVQVIITVPQFTEYELPPTKSEVVFMHSIPNLLINGNTPISLYEPSNTEVFIMSRTATFSGTWFSSEPKKQFEIRNIGQYSIIIDFAFEYYNGILYYGAKWSTDVITNRDTTQELINEIIDSDKSDTTVGERTIVVNSYQNAIARQLEDFDVSYVTRVNATRITITVPAFPGYELPKYDNFELITAAPIPASALEGETTVTQRLGPIAVTLEGIFLLLNTSVQVPSAGVKGSVYITFSAPHSVNSNGEIAITIPTGHPNSYTTGFVFATGSVGVGSAAGMTGSLAVVGPTNAEVSITGFDSIPTTEVTIELTNIRSHANNVSESWQIRTKDVAGNIIDEDITTLLATPAKNIILPSNVLLTCDQSQNASVCYDEMQGVPNAGVESTIRFNFTTIGNVPAVGMVRIYFPVGFILGAVEVIEMAGISMNNSVPLTSMVSTCNTSTVCMVTVSGFEEIEAGDKSLVLSRIQSHSNKLSETFMLETTDNFGNIYDEIRSGLTYTPAMGNLTNVVFSCDIAAGPSICGFTNVYTTIGNTTHNTTVVSHREYNGLPNAGVLDSITITFTTRGRLNSNGRIVLTFPLGILLESPTLLDHNLPGPNVILSQTGQVVVLNNFNDSIAPSEVSFTIGNVRSHAAKLSGPFTINTTDSEGYLYDALTGPRFTPIRGNITNVTITLPNSGVIGTVTVTMTIAGQVPSDGRINVTVPHDYALGMYNHASGKLEFFATVSRPSGGLNGTGLTIIEIEEATNSAIIGGFDTIEPGQIHFELDYVKPGAGAAGTFMIRTTDNSGVIIDDTRFGDQAGQATSSTGIAPVTGSLGDLELAAPTAGAVSEFQVSMTTVGEVEGTGKILIYFPVGFEIAYVTLSGAGGRLWLSSNMTASANTTVLNCNITTTCGGGMVTVSGFERIAPGKLTFTLGNVRSPGAGTYTFLVETGDVSGFVIDQKTVTVEVAPSIMTETVLVVPNAGVEYEAIIEFSNVGYTPQDGQMHFGFPSKTRFGQPNPFRFGTVSIKELGGSLAGLSPVLTVFEQTVILSSLSPLPPGPVSITLKGVVSPSSAESAPFLLQTLDSNGLVLNQNPQLLSVTPPVGRLHELNIIFPPAGMKGNMNVSFATEGTIVNCGKIKIQFPDSFDLPYIPVTADHPSGVLDEDTTLEVHTDRVAKLVSVTVLGGIPKGLLRFQLYPITIPRGFSSGDFLIQTAEEGPPDRVVDQVDHTLINTAELNYNWDPELTVSGDLIRSPADIDVQMTSLRG